jgi:hypothetical protein
MLNKVTNTTITKNEGYLLLIKPQLTFHNLQFPKIHRIGLGHITICMLAFLIIKAKIVFVSYNWRNS